MYTFWSNVNKDLEGLSYISNINHLLLHSSPSVYFWPPSDLNKKNCFSVCFPTCYTVSLIINCVPVFMVFAFLKRSCFQRRERAGPLFSWPPALVARSLSFHPGYPGSIPGQEAKISHQDHSQLSLQGQCQTALVKGSGG